LGRGRDEIRAEGGFDRGPGKAHGQSRGNFRKRNFMGVKFFVRVGFFMWLFSGNGPGGKHCFFFQIRGGNPRFGGRGATGGGRAGFRSCFCLRNQTGFDETDLLRTGGGGLSFFKKFSGFFQKGEKTTPGGAGGLWRGGKNKNFKGGGLSGAKNENGETRGGV